MEDIYNLQRFIDAQNQDFEAILQELKFGQKQGHWMWYVFPQIKGLGRSEVAERFSISSRQEAIAYFEHPVLGARLKQCTQLVIDVAGLSIEEIFHYPNNLKFHSSMTLFAVRSIDNQIFISAIDEYFNGKYDEFTLDILKSQE